MMKRKFFSSTKKNKLKIFSSIIYYIEKGKRAREIAKILRWSEQKLNYYLNLMLNKNLIQKGIRTSYREYKVTERGRELLKEFLTRGEISSIPLPIRLHQCYFQFVFAEMPEIPIGFKECHRKNHTDYIKKDDNVELEIITGKRPNFLIRIHNIYGKTKEECRSKAYWFAYTIAQEYCEKHNFKLLLPPVVKEQKWSWGIPNPSDPVLKKILEEGKQTIKFDNTIVTYDESLGKGISEIEFKGEKSGELAEGYARLPLLNMEILKELKEQRRLIQGSIPSLNAIQNAILLVSQNITKLQEVILKQKEKMDDYFALTEALRKRIKRLIPEEKVLEKENGWEIWKKMKKV